MDTRSLSVPPTAEETERFKSYRVEESRCPVQGIVRHALDVCDRINMTDPLHRAEFVACKLEACAARAMSKYADDFAGAAAVVRRLVRSGD